MTWDNEFWKTFLENSVLGVSLIAMVILFIRSAGQAINAQEQARKDYTELAGPIFQTVLEQTRTLQEFRDKFCSITRALDRMKDKCPYIKDTLNDVQLEEEQKKDEREGRTL